MERTTPLLERQHMTRTGTTLSRDPRRLIRCTLSGVAATLAVVGTAALAITPGTPTATKNYGAVVSGLPLQFEPNVGLSGDDVEFSARGAAYAISLNRQGAEFSLGQPATQPTASPDVLRLAVVGTRPAATPSAEGPLPGRVNYLIGNDPSKWRTDVPTYAKVRYSGVYPGIDLVYYGTQGRLEYDFAVAPGANAGKIRLAFQGADRLRLDGNGNLEVSAHGRTLAFERPVAYQLVGERHVPIAATYRIQGNAIKFDIGPYDHSRALIIDPVLSYFSYLGGAAADNVGAAIPSSGNLSGQAAAVDGAGHLYVVGYTYSSNFPTKGTGQIQWPVDTVGIRDRGRGRCHLTRLLDLHRRLVLRLRLRDRCRFEGQRLYHRQHFLRGLPGNNRRLPDHLWSEWRTGWRIADGHHELPDASEREWG